MFISFCGNDDLSFSCGNDDLSHMCEYSTAMVIYYCWLGWQYMIPWKNIKHTKLATTRIRYIIIQPYKPVKGSIRMQDMYL